MSAWISAGHTTYAYVEADHNDCVTSRAETRGVGDNREKAKRRIIYWDIVE